MNTRRLQIGRHFGETVGIKCRITTTNQHQIALNLTVHNAPGRTQPCRKAVLRPQRIQRVKRGNRLGDACRGCAALLLLAFQPNTGFRMRHRKGNPTAQLFRSDNGFNIAHRALVDLSPPQYRPERSRRGGRQHPRAGRQNRSR